MRRAIAQSVRMVQPAIFRAGSRRGPARIHNFAAAAAASSPNASRNSISIAASKAFSSSSRTCYAEAEGSEGQQQQQQQKKQKKKAEEDTGPVGKSPFSVFVDVLREELQKSREMNENIRQLQGETTKAMDSETMKKMKAAYEKARVSRYYRGYRSRVVSIMSLSQAPKFWKMHRQC